MTDKDILTLVIRNKGGPCAKIPIPEYFTCDWCPMETWCNSHNSYVSSDSFMRDKVIEAKRLMCDLEIKGILDEQA